MMRAAAWLLLCGTLVAGESPRTVSAYPGSTPLMDGRIDAAEWADATQLHSAEGWMSQMSPVRDSKDLSYTVWVKHDGRRLYFAFRVKDDVLYGIDTPRWLPPNNAKAHELTREGWPWFGDEVEILLDSRRVVTGKDMAAGDGGSWQMVCNLTKSRLGGVGKGGLMEGEPRSKAAAWATYQKWIRSGAMEAAVGVRGGGEGKPLPDGRGSETGGRGSETDGGGSETGGRGSETGGRVYEMEWAISFEPCLEIEPGRFYNVALGDRAFGLNLAVGDLDEPEKGRGNFGLFHHEEWWAGEKNAPTQLRSWGTLWMRTTPAPR